MTRLLLAAACVIVAGRTGGIGDRSKPAIQMLKTDSGVRFGVYGGKPAKPAPTFFVLAGGVEDSLKRAEFNEIGHILADKGYLSVALDLPCHGKDQVAGESGIAGWRTRLEKGQPLVEDFAKKASAVLDKLVKDGYTDAKKVGAAGTSRGGFMALHLAAAEPRIGWVVAFAPVTDLLAVSEFQGSKNDKPMRDLDLKKHAARLAGRPVWLCIGNDDRRVSTDEAILFTRRLVTAAAGKSKIVPVELHVMPTVGHTIHATAHEEAARWVMVR
ncbi:MAG: hypothetical protein FJ271_14330 [Planctomycetes bacterium]|nr:hypothetical protein [Planctomycetota bacterium]